MIKLQREPKPAYLSDAKVAELTATFKSDKKATVWKHNDIHSTLLTSSNSKCAFCESELQISATYMEIEHFKFKNDFPDDVVKWENLLPSCKRCNTKKGQHNVVVEPIVNPFDQNPKDHLTQAGCRIYFKDVVGKSTRDILDLNDDRLMRPRFEVWNYVTAKVEEIWEDLENKIRVTRHDRNKLSGLLISCQADRAFSAFASSALQECVEYLHIVEKLKINGVWDADIETLHQNSIALALDKRNS